MAETYRPLTDVEIAGIQAETELAYAEAALKRLELTEKEEVRRRKAASNNEHRIINFFGSVNAISSQAAIETLGSWAREDEPGTKFTIIFNSPGGSVLDGLALFDYIQELKAKGFVIETVTLGMAASMGGVLLQAGSHRVAGRNAFMLIHEAATMIGGKASDIEDQAKFLQRLQAKILDILAERSTLNVAAIKKNWKKTDWWLDADEMLKLGFVDEIRG